MWKSLDADTKKNKCKDPAAKPEWFDEDKFVPWSKFKGSARPDDFTGNWAFLQYDIMKAAYLHYLTKEEIESSHLQTSYNISSVPVTLPPDQVYHVQPVEVVQVLPVPVSEQHQVTFVNDDQIHAHIAFDPSNEIEIPADDQDIDQILKEALAIQD